MKKVSVIVPCYNASEYLDQCMRSLLDQTIGREELEVILIDDVSTDDTKIKIQEYAGNYPDIVRALYLEENMRQGGARNRGIDIATGEYISFLDADDWMDLESYKKLYERAKGSDLDILQFDRTHVERGEEHRYGFCQLEGDLDLEDLETRRLFLMSGLFSAGCTNKLFRREMVWNSQARFAEKMIFEEPLFVYPQFFYAKRVGCTKAAYYYCRIHEHSTMSEDAHSERRLLDHLSVQRKVWEWMEQTKIGQQLQQEVEYYFLATYYAETLCMAGVNCNLSTQTWEQMREYVQKECSEWEKNPYLYTEDGRFTYEILSSLKLQEKVEEEEFHKWIRQLYLRSQES